ncbi:MAG: hypothetical protein IPJ08_02965 [Burkholderiales bacterium]|nr:hypothetical protein [Burkholderiales bacterium]
MGPIALFDKSFLQSLTVDESVWFDHFFLPVVCPIFFVETLADLTKQKRPGSTRRPQDEVRILADKSPVMSAAPCVHHMQLAIANLLGYAAPHLGQVPLAGGRPVRSKDGKPGVVFEISPEAESFSRWQRGQFLEVERDAASSWRAMLANLDLPAVALTMRRLGITPKNCKSVNEAYGIAASLVHTRAETEAQIVLLFNFLHIPSHLHGEILHKWTCAGSPPLALFAAYAAHVLTVELFFQIALAANIISAERASNRADVAYLFYLPFCHLFVSGDKLHQRCAPPFLTKKHDFLWGPDLKTALTEINQRMSSATETERQQGLHKLAPRPPGDSTNLVISMWEKHYPLPVGQEAIAPHNPVAERKLVEHINDFVNAPEVPEVASIPADDLDGVAIERLVPPRRGSWWVIPKAVADKEQTRE